MWCHYGNGIVTIGQEYRDYGNGDNDIMEMELSQEKYVDMGQSVGQSEENNETQETTDTQETMDIQETMDTQETIETQENDDYDESIEFDDSYSARFKRKKLTQYEQDDQCLNRYKRELFTRKIFDFRRNGLYCTKPIKKSGCILKIEGGSIMSTKDFQELQS